MNAGPGSGTAHRHLYFSRTGRSVHLDFAFGLARSGSVTSTISTTFSMYSAQVLHSSDVLDRWSRHQRPSSMFRIRMDRRSGTLTLSG